MKDAFYAFMCRRKVLRYTCNGHPFIVEYHRTPFWTNETPSLKLFVKEKADSWHGQVWLEYPNGGRCGFETIHIFSWLPRRRMLDFLKYEAQRISKLCFSKDEAVNI